MVSYVSTAGGGRRRSSPTRNSSNSNNHSNDSMSSIRYKNNNNNKSNATEYGSHRGGGGGGDSTTISSPMSVLEQWQRDAKGAMEDAYANYVLGDDTGESARLVMVSNPSDDLITVENSKRNQYFFNNKKRQPLHHQEESNHPPHILMNQHNKGKGSLHYQQLQQQKQQLQQQESNNPKRRGVPTTNQLLVSHREYYSDANSTYQRRVLTSHGGGGNGVKGNPHATKFASCGVTYVEINGRAYVHAVDEASPAYKIAGIRPKDCVQYAAVLAKEWEDPLGIDFDIISSQALEREDTGQRITFEELKRVFLQGSGIINDGFSSSASYHAATQSSPDHHPNGVLGPNGSPPRHHHHPPPPAVPSTIRIGKNPCGGVFVPDEDDDQDTTTDHHPLSGGGGTSGGISNNNNDTGNKNEPRPVVLVFRRTKQRPPKAWNVWPNYRLDDECDVACQILHSLTTANNNNNNIPSSRNNHKNRRDNRSSLHRSGSGRRSGRNRNRNGGCLEDYFTEDDDESTGTMFLDKNENFRRSNSVKECSKNLFPSDQKNNKKNGSNGTNDEEDEENMNEVEASTIRGMIQKAVGLAFVRSNKVVFGVSVSGGSGIVVSRLSDGTWSAPSLIGMAGMGFGIQIGLEVAQYIFILQSKEALEHFQRGGSFTLGGNVGLAVAGMFGREAIGAASVSSALCGIKPPPTPIKEDEYNYENDEEDLYFENMSNSIEDVGDDDDDDDDDENDYDVNTKTGERILNKDRRRRRRRRRRSKKKYDSACGRITSCAGSGGGRNRSRNTAATDGETVLLPVGCVNAVVGDLTGDLTVTSLLLESGTATGVAPIVAYAKSEGLYVGVSLEGSRIFTRNEMNAKAYKYSSYKHKPVTARDILTGKIVSRPYEAECLYSLLHQIELTHELSCLPPLPQSKFLFPNATFSKSNNNNNNKNGGTVASSSKNKNNKSTTTGVGTIADGGYGDWTRSWEATSPPYVVATATGASMDDNSKRSSASGRTFGDDSTLCLDSTLMKDEIDEYYDKFQDFLFGGITVLRISTSTPNKREQRTLWLQSAGPTSGGGRNESSVSTGSGTHSNNTIGGTGTGSVRIGFVSKLYSATAQRKHLSASIIQDVPSPKSGGHHHAGGGGGGGGSGIGSNLSGIGSGIGGGNSVVSEMDHDELTLDSALMVRTFLLF